MSWIPNLNRLFILIKKIETDENSISDSTELFWLFCTGMMKPDEFHERMAWWRNYHAEQSKLGGGFLDQELETIMKIGFDNPDDAAQLVINRLDKLAEVKRIEYLPDEPEPMLGLYVYLNIEAARLFRFLKIEGYSERTRETLNSCLNYLNRCTKATSGYSKSPWSREFSISLAYVGSFIQITEFLVQKSDGNYEGALKSLFWGFASNIMASEILSENIGLLNSNVGMWIPSVGLKRNIWRTAPWMRDLDPQDPVDCFEAIRAKNSHEDLKDITAQCSLFVTVTKNWWPDPNEEKEIEVRDGRGELWNLPEYWQRALAWVEDQLTPSQFKEILSEREEQASEKRLRTYFFEEEFWSKLPERTKKSLISAERDWFGGSSVRIEAILNELTIAVQELLIQEFWKPLEKWFKEKGQNYQGAQAFTSLMAELSIRGKLPTILDLEHICRMPITGSYLVEIGVGREDRVWFIQVLQQSLYHLRQARNRAEHESGNQWTRQELNKFYNEFMGIGQAGVIRGICRIFLTQK